MAEVKNSSLLEKIIDRAKRLNSDDASLTAEKFLVATIDLIEDGSSTDDDKSELSQILSLQRRGDIDFDRIKQGCLNSIRSSSKASFSDIIYMQKIMLQAKHDASGKNESQLSADAVLQLILSAPSNTIEQYLSSASPSSSESAGNQASSDAAEDESKKLLRALMGQSSSPEEKKTEEKTPEITENEEIEETEEEPKANMAALVEKVRKTQESLLKQVYGQDHAVNVFTNGYFQAELISMTGKTHFRPRATFLFAGSPGVGKTFLAEQSAEVLALPFKRFDMSEYSDYGSDMAFCGYDRNYRNPAPGNVTNFVKEHPKCILLFDEIEKAHITIIHLFLQMLDGGRLKDNYLNDEISFKDTLIIFTTNAGHQLYENSECNDLSGLSRKVILKALQQDKNRLTGEPYFPAALCSRFASGNVVMFNSISAHNLIAIAKKRNIAEHKEFRRKIRN